MGNLIYSTEELEAEAEYATPHVECGLRLHGGFDSAGHYLSPRTKNRWPAITAWHQQLENRGVPIVEATTSLLTEPNFPNVDQQVFLLCQGIEQSFWDSLTITGLIEARGRALAELVAPDFQEIIVEDLSGTTLGHMNKGLLTTHGWDEGGKTDSGIGGHDVMWFAARDLVFGKDRFPIPEAPASISREKDEREMAQIPPEHEALIAFLMNLLMIEVRAERVFDFYERVIRSPLTFPGKDKESAHAVALIDRIRKDEAVHVAWLRSAISEFRSFTVKSVSGETVSGASMIDPVWASMVHWHGVEMHAVSRPAAIAEVKANLLAVENGDALFSEFNSLAA